VIERIVNIETELNALDRKAARPSALKNRGRTSHDVFALACLMIRLWSKEPEVLERSSTTLWQELLDE
jgi:hypothetical protein